MKSILVTGASGFVGRHTLQSLLHADLLIHAVSSRSSPTLNHPSIIWHQINLHNESAVEKLLQTIEPYYLLHLAWYTKHNEYWTSIENQQWLNTSIHLLQSFAENGGKRALLTGTCAEYDWQNGWCDEKQTACSPNSLYGQTKYDLFLKSQEIAVEKKISLAWARLFFLFGKHEYPERLIPSAIHHLLNKQFFAINNGNYIRDFMYVEDVAHALATTLLSNVTGPINIASGQACTLQEIIFKIADKLNSKHLINCKENEAHSITANVLRLHNEVKWQPRFSLDTAIDETISWWQRN